MAFTIVFDGEISKLPFNPMKAETPFGKVIAAGIGNALDQIEHIIEIEDAATKLLEVIKKNDDRDP